MKKHKFYIGTTRFNNKTWSENVKWREKHQHKGCVYALKKRIVQSVPKNAIIVVLEMNNDTNKIMGIGIIKNKRDMTQNIKIYYNNDIYYNKFVYHSNMRMDRNQIPYMKMIEVFEDLVFRGSKHIKRGLGITIFPWERFPRKKTRLRVEKFFVLIKNILDVEKEKKQSLKQKRTIAKK